MSERGRELVPAGEPLAVAAARLRAEAAARYTEVDLLVAALHEHIEDLRTERDALLRQVARLRDDARRERAAWLARGMRGPHRVDFRLGDGGAGGVKPVVRGMQGGG